MLRAVFDSTVLRGDHLLMGADARTVLGYAAEGLCAVHVPAVVVAEVTVGHDRSVRRSRDSILGHLGELRRLGMERDHTELITTEADELREGYPGRLDDALDRPGVAVEPWPDVAHEVVAGRAMRRRLPFREVGEGTVGYRDTLVWFTVLAVARAHPDDDVVLVSGNRKDFAAKGGEVLLHGDLRREAGGDVDGDGMVSLVEDLSGLLDVLLGRPEILRHLDGERMAAIREALHDLHVDLMDATWWPQYDPRDGDFAAGDVDAGIPQEIDNIDLREIDGPYDLAVDVVGEEDGLELIQCSYIVNASFDGIVMKSDYIHLDAQGDFTVFDYDWSDHAMWVDFQRTVRLSVDIQYDPDARRVVSLDLVHSEPAVPRGG